MVLHDLSLTAKYILFVYLYNLRVPITVLFPAICICKCTLWGYGLLQYVALLGESSKSQYDNIDAFATTVEKTIKKYGWEYFDIRL